MRILFAIVTGYLIFAISAALLFQLTGHDPHASPGVAFGIASVIWGGGFAVLGGYFAAKASRGQSLLPSALVGCLIAAGALLSLALTSPQGSRWSQLSALLLMAPAACAGGLIKRHKQP